MQALLYPAMLGSYFVLFISKYFTLEYGIRVFIEPKFLFSLLLLLYFCVSYLINQSLSNHKIYNLLSFIFDFIELVIMFLCFTSLRISYDLEYLPDLKGFYFFASLIPINQVFWNISLRERERIYYLLDLVLFLILLLSFFWGYKYLIFNYLIIAMLSIMLVTYIIFLISKDYEFSN